MCGQVADSGGEADVRLVRPLVPHGDRTQLRDSNSNASVPAWFTANRVHGHTRLLLRLWDDKPETHGVAAAFKSLGAAAFTRHAKSGKEDPPSLPGNPNGPGVQKFIDQDHAEGLRVFAYYWHMSQESLEHPHPDWVCKTRAGRPIKGN